MRVIIWGFECINHTPNFFFSYIPLLFFDYCKLFFKTSQLINGLQTQGSHFCSILPSWRRRSATKYIWLPGRTAHSCTAAVPGNFPQPLSLAFGIFNLIFELLLAPVQPFGILLQMNKFVVVLPFGALITQLRTEFQDQILLDGNVLIQCSEPSGFCTLVIKLSS